MELLSLDEVAYGVGQKRAWYELVMEVSVTGCFLSQCKGDFNGEPSDSFWQHNRGGKLWEDARMFQAADFGFVKYREVILGG
jgi:hypothetical protein